MRRAAVLPATVLLLAALVGCSEIGSLSEKAQIDLAMQKLSGELDELAGISLDYTADLQADYTYTVLVSATAPDLTVQQFADAAELASRELRGGVFAHTPTQFELSTHDGRSLSLAVFDRSADELLREVSLAAELGDAYGAPASIAVYGDGPVSISFADWMPSPDWQALRALFAADSASHSVGFPGVGFSGGFPPAQVTGLVDAVGTVVEPSGDPEVFVYIDWAEQSTFVTVGVDDFDPAQPGDSALWERVVQVAGLVGDARLAAASFMFQGNGTAGGAVHFDGCAEAVPASDADAALAQALVASGVGGGIQPGQCLRA